MCMHRKTRNWPNGLSQLSSNVWNYLAHGIIMRSSARRRKKMGMLPRCAWKSKHLLMQYRLKPPPQSTTVRFTLLFFTPHWLEVYGNKDKVYYVKQVKRVELQKHPLHDVKFWIKVWQNSLILEFFHLGSRRFSSYSTNGISGKT